MCCHHLLLGILKGGESREAAKCLKPVSLYYPNPLGQKLIFHLYLQKATQTIYYCGQTDNLERRVSQHNDPDYRGSLTTKRIKGPWELVWFEEFATRSEAIIKERYIKKRGISRFLK